MTDWKPTMLTASAPSGEMMTWINPSAIEQLQREVDALKVMAETTPVEDEVTEAMVEAGKDAWGRAVNRYLDDTDCWVAVYSAMRAAAAPTPGPSAELVALRARCERLAAVVRAVSTALAPYDLHTIYTSQTPRITNAEASRIGDAIDALHPGDTEEAK